VELEDKIGNRQNRFRLVYVIRGGAPNFANTVRIGQKYLGGELSAIVPNCNVQSNRADQERAERDGLQD
jgi:hypothetical protein